jgi:Rad3-related DNA helicase
MSATIGEHRTFMSELGIYENFESIVVPNIWPAESRPILDLDVPAISWKSTEEDLQQHAKEIARVINASPGSWNGLVHVPSKRMAQDLSQRLRKLTGRKVWISQEGQGTEEMLVSWLEFENRNRGALAVAYAFHEGVDLPGLNINISARVPYPDMKSGSYEHARFNFDVKAAQVRVANTLQQQQGRNRRGYAEHYGDKAEKLNVLADAKWRRLKWCLSQDFVEAVKNA